MKNIIFDLDGTILESDKSLSEETVGIIKKISKDNVITIATGRSLVGLPKSISEIEECINFYITSNGTTIYNNEKEVIYRDTIVAKDIEAFLCNILSNKDLVVEVLVDGEWHIDEKGIENLPRINIKLSVLDYILNTRIVHTSLMSFLLTDNKNIEKISINFCSPISEQLIVSIHNLCNKFSLNYFSEHAHKVDVFKKTTSKGTAISFLSKYCGVKLCDTISFGNDENDIEMFKTSSVSVCMPNSTINAKRNSSIVLRLNDSKRIKRAFNILKKKGLYC